MKKFQLEILFRIIGIGSASGLLYKDNSVFVVSDNGGYLYEYKISDNILDKIPLIENEPMENIPKKTKADFEAIATKGDSLYVFGSGSTEQRNKMAIVNRQSKTILTTDLSLLYASMRSLGNISDEDFNIEGVVYTSDAWYFFQRGNSGTGKNAVFTVTGNIEEENFSVIYKEFKLPKIGGVQACFTDATLVGDKIYFLATAENTTSAYKDGEVAGSFVGRMNLKKMKIDFTKKITSSHKFEGIAMFEDGSDTISFLLCEDNDTSLLESNIYKLTVYK